VIDMRTLLSIVLALIATLACAEEPQPPALRLPSDARPTHYALTLTVVPGAQTAAGEIAIDVALASPHAVLWLNAEDLKVTHASVGDAATRVGMVTGHDQFLGLTFDPPLPAGSHRVELAFEAGQSGNSTRGIFTLQNDGAWYSMTQFEPTSARRAFPCFDEPGFKVPWDITLRVPAGQVALANTPAAGESPDGEGMKRVRFATTRPLPSYLVAFAVGPWEAVDAGRVGSSHTPMRIVVPRGHATEARFAARAYPQLFEELERWFGIAHPYPKLDQVAIPLTVGFAMENAGLITYGMPNVLAKPDAETAYFRHWSVSVAAHEMAHQWFGDLVTPAWWDDIWLNESFATWMADKVVDRWRPEYEHGAAGVEARAHAMAEDALSSARRIREPIVARGDIYNAFDAITYDKGATVLGMFERWIGPEPFRQGIRRYLEARADGTATLADFTAALSQASGRPVAPALSTFLDQNGVPRVAVELACERKQARLELTQSRYTPVGAVAAGGQRWQVPVCVRYESGGRAHEACTLLDGASTSLALGNGCPAYVFANAGGQGYYLADYRGDLLARLRAHQAALPAAERASLIHDLRELLRAGAVDPREALRWLRIGARAKERHVAMAAIDLAQFVRDDLVGDDERARFTAFVRATFGPRARKLGFAPVRGEDDDAQLLRRALVRFVGPDDPKLAAEARRLAHAWLADRKAVDPTMVDSVLAVAAQTGDSALLDAMRAELARTRDEVDRRNLMVALFSFADPALLRRSMGLLLDPAIDIRESLTALRFSIGPFRPQRTVTDFIATHFDALEARVERDRPGGWPGYAERLCTARERNDVEAFWRPRIERYAGGPRNLAQALESIDLCVQARAANASGVRAFLAAW
jgi:alanyl aminopeptidase